MIQLELDRIPSPIGEIVIVVDDGQLCALDFSDYADRMERLLRQRYPSYTLVPTVDPSGVSAALAAYLQGELDRLDTLAVKLTGTPFQQEVWRALRTVPPGTTRSYGEIAAQLGRPAAARAVGLANSQNPVAIVVPCHRVVGANAALTGYAGGLTRKQWLLQHEGATVRPHRRILISAG